MSTFTKTVQIAQGQTSSAEIKLPSEVGSCALAAVAVIAGATYTTSIKHVLGTKELDTVDADGVALTFGIAADKIVILDPVLYYVVSQTIKVVLGAVAANDVVLELYFREV